MLSCDGSVWVVSYVEVDEGEVLFFERDVSIGDVSFSEA